MDISTLLEDIRAFNFDDWGKLLSPDQVRLLGYRFLHRDPPSASVAGFLALRDLIEYARRVEPRQHTLGQLIESLEACGYRHLVIEINKSLSPAASAVPSPSFVVPPPTDFSSVPAPAASSTSIPPTVIDTEIKVLILSGDNTKASDFVNAVKHEIKAHDKVIQKKLVLVHREPPEIDDLVQIIADERPNIIQFLAHGDDDARMGIGKGLLKGSALCASFRRIDRLYKHKPDIIIFTVCNSAALVAELSTYSKLVVGATGKLNTGRAQQYVKAFYSGLLFPHGTLHLAHEEGLDAIEIGDAEDLDVKTDLVTNLSPDDEPWKFQYHLAK